MSFFGGLFGGSQRDDIRRGKNEANQILDEYYNSGRGIEEQYFDQAIGYLEPGLRSGDRAQTRLDNALGINGAEAQQQFYDAFQEAPGFKAQLAHGTKTVSNNANAQGYSLSGRAQKELQSYGQKYQQEEYRDHLNRLERRTAAANSQRQGAADLTSRTGNNLAQSYYGQGGAKASNAINSASAIANTRFTIGDLSGLIGNFAEGYSAFAKPPGT
ncbi:MAG: hypothetical protein AAFY06_00210 [Pseudomonadota bacterium]